MNEMIDRVGEAISAQVSLQNKGVIFIWNPDALAAVARAAIEAMREPTEAMTWSADPEFNVEGIWQQMIDAALKEP